MRKLVLLLGALSLVWAGCGEDGGLDSGNLGGECERKVLIGDYTIRSTEEATALERKAG